MAKEIRLPQLGETMDNGTIVSCLVNVGDQVKKGDIIFEIETDKATLEMESPVDGFVKHILAEVNQTLPVGAPIMILGDKDEKVPQSFIDSLKGGGVAIPKGSTFEAATHGEERGTRDERRETKVLASPRAKKLAEELGIDLSKVTGTGPASKITEEDVKAIAEKSEEPRLKGGAKYLAPRSTWGLSSEAAEAEVKLGDTVPLNRLQRITAERMLKSKHEIPCFYLTVRADVTDLVALRAKMNETGDVHPVRNSIGNNMTQKEKISNGVKVSYNDFIIKAVAAGLEKYPIMTGQLAGDSIKLADAIHIGLAIAVPDGLVAPVVKNVNKKDVKQIARDSQALIERARGNKLAPVDLEGGCITVSNLGSFGIENFIPIVVPGQCSILGIGRITDTCVPDSTLRSSGPSSVAPRRVEASSLRSTSDGNILVRKLMSMTLSVDHKVTNGAYAAQFLDFVRKLLEDISAFGNL